MNGWRNDKGSILVVSLWVVALLSLLAASVTTRSQLAVRQEKWRDIEAEGMAILDGLAAGAVARLKADADVEFDAYTEDWGRPFEARASGFAADGTHAPAHWADSVVRIRAIDESGKVNVNLAPEALLRALMREIGVENPGVLASAIVDWRDPDDIGLNEGDVYAGMDPPYAPANADLARIKEVLFVKDVAPELFFGEDENRNGRLDPTEDDGDLFLPTDNADGLLQLGLADVLTVYGDGVINANGVTETVLRAALSIVLADTEAGSLAGELIRRRQGRDGVDGTEDDRPFSNDAELAEALGEAAYQRLLSAGIEFGISSKAVQFIVQIENTALQFRRTAELVAVREDDELRVTSWHESR
jgi:type II secretory pathway component PulK